jgi:hypothetical protein
LSNSFVDQHRSAAVISPPTCKERGTIDILPQRDIVIGREMARVSVREAEENAHSGFLVRKEKTTFFGR